MKKYLPWIPKVVAAIILLQTLAFKFTAHEQSVELFTQLNLLGMGEAFGRVGTGIVELIVSIMLLVPRTAKLGALGVIGLMLGALFFHVTILGFAGDNLPLSVMAVVALVSAGITWWHESHKS